MSELARSEQLRSDTLATMQIANDMVQALFANLREIIANQDQELVELRAQITKLEIQLDAAHEQAKLNHRRSEDSHAATSRTPM